ncbi:glycosyltransferase [Lacihabitans sp. LS3-19]|uniref:glycosyltransferase n=1 Tax=Lacihabitans sp. LS3-19 TaxID=2487335 RepID=UPI0020CEDF04|nr:glycosyltransferase [Lacihabitans sp. LS3-19]MCP9768666.1 glycosyltransferase [Lacihabitans sp. LS3-19]
MKTSLSHSSENHLGTIFQKNIQINTIKVLMITSYPPRQCGIATYSQDLEKAIINKFGHSFAIEICALESNNEIHEYSPEINQTLNVDNPDDFFKIANYINEDKDIHLVLIQHEFGFYAKVESAFISFLHIIKKPIAIVFHTVLPKPSSHLLANVKAIANQAEEIIVMTNSSSKILHRDYYISPEKINVIPHGTHLVAHLDKNILKEKYKLSNRKVLSTFGLLGSGKSIETTLKALPGIIKNNQDVMFLIIGKTHPSIVKNEGEVYRRMLTDLVNELNLQNNVRFINEFLPLPTLLEYLQLTDIYLFTSKDPNQAVSGTFSYAISCGCPIISTPIPHAIEVLSQDAGKIIPFEDSEKLTEEVINLLKDKTQMYNFSQNGLHKIAPTAWENSAIAHADLFQKLDKNHFQLHYAVPEINLDHIIKMTTDFGIIQFSKINIPDIETGYTLDDNARAMIAFCKHFELTNDSEDLKYIETYLNFIGFCVTKDGDFLNYVDKNKAFTAQNFETNLEDSNGRAVWALGYLIQMDTLVPYRLIRKAFEIFDKVYSGLKSIHSTRAMAFITKGLCHIYKQNPKLYVLESIQMFADRIVQMYRHESSKNWEWYEDYLTYGNSLLPEAMAMSYVATQNPVYKQIAIASFDFLLKNIFRNDKIKVVSNQNWIKKGEDFIKENEGGEQPIDVAYTILALTTFFNIFKDESYLIKRERAFEWFLGNNHLHQIIYNPCTGGCYDGLESTYVNLNQGSESTVSYLMARFCMEKTEPMRTKKTKIEVKSRELV